MSNETRRILLVEDEKAIRDAVTAYLERENYWVTAVGDGQEALEEFSKHHFDLVILDLMLPRVPGERVCRAIRDNSDVPIIMLTAKGEVEDRIIGLELGADDYLVKPFSPAELVARVKSHIQIHERLLEHREKQKDQGIQVKNLLILPKARRVYLSGEELSLANKEFELLLFMAQNPNIVFSKDTLFDRIWGMDAAGNTATVTVHINRLREKLEKDEDSPQFIETVWGAGYRFKVE